jgi:GT2 family glycosyltransferase
VVVSTRGRGAKIAPLVESVLKCTETNFEMVVVDQSDDHETQTAVEPFLSDRRLRYVRSDQRGASRGRNLAVSMTTAPVIVITDDDCIVPSEWLTCMLRPFDENPRIGVAFCTVDPVPVQEAGLTPSIHFIKNRTFESVAEAWVEARDRLVLGAGMAVRRTTFDQLQGFDELLGPGSNFPSCEDNDLSWRALLQGWLVYQNADVAVLHDGFRPMDEVRALVRRDCFAAGGAMAKYLRTGHWRMASVVASWIYRLGVRGPAEDLLALRSPRGFKRPLWLLQGVAQGLRTPMNGATLRYNRVAVATPRK